MIGSSDFRAPHCPWRLPAPPMTFGTAFGLTAPGWPPVAVGLPGIGMPVGDFGCGLIGLIAPAWFCCAPAWMPPIAVII